MNLLLFEQSEVRSSGRLCIDDERAVHMIKVLRVRPGALVRVGQLDGRIGKAVVEEVKPGAVSLRLESLEEKCEPAAVSLILAMPRPQILKKVLQTVAAMGLDRLILVSSQRVEKSYFFSPLLREEKLSHYLRLGLEQGAATDMPGVSLHKNFRQFVQNELGFLIEGQAVRLLPHPRAEMALWDLGLESEIKERTQVLAAIGPEGGWSDEEVEAFRERGFRSFHCGPRILRVDTAVSSFLGQLELLRRLAS